MFSRIETAELSGLPYHKLVYFDRKGLLKPTKMGHSKKPTIIYTWPQLLELRAVKELRDSVSLQTIRKLLNFLESHSDDPRLISNDLLIANGDVIWLTDDLKLDDLGIIAASKSNRNIGQVVSLELLQIPNLGVLREQIFETAKHSEVIDFEDFRKRINYPYSVA